MTVRVSRPRVLHVNDCASVAHALVDEAVREGMDWQLHMPSARRQRPMATALYRAWDVVDFRRKAIGYDLVHIHYGLMAYYGFRLRQPFALHLHGTDLRSDIRAGSVRSSLIRWGLRHARWVYFSTPDMAEEALRWRPDASWLPAPIQEHIFDVPSGIEPASGVLITSRWDDVKGADRLIEAVRVLRKTRPEIPVIGFDWGMHRNEAKRAGAHLVPLVSRARLPGFLRSFQVAIGQALLGFLTVTELEVLACEVPLVMPFRYGSRYPEQPPLVSVRPEGIADAVLSLLGDESGRASVGRGGRDWVRKYHSARAAVEHLTHAYSESRER